MSTDSYIFKVAMLVKAFCLYMSKIWALESYTFKIEIEDSVF